MGRLLLYIQHIIFTVLKIRKFFNTNYIDIATKSIKYCFVYITLIIGSFQMFCTLYVVSLKINLFHKVHLQIFNVIYTVLYHSGPTFGQLLYSCQEPPSLSMRLITRGHLLRHLLNASEAFPTEWFLQFWEQVKG